MSISLPHAPCTPVPPRLLLLCLLLLPTSTHAQEAERHLTLEEARRIAQEHNPRYQQAQNHRITARAGERQSRAAFLPDLRLNLSSGGYLSRTFTGLDPFGQPVRRADPLDFTRSFSSQSISLGLPLFDGGARFRELRAARANQIATEAGVRVEATSLAAELTRRYYDARRKAEMIALEEDLLKAARSRREATERLLRIASATPVDLLGAEIAIAEQERALEQARGEARKAMLLLNEEMGMGEGKEWALVSDAPPVFDPSTLKADSLVARANAISPRLQQLQAQATAAEQRRRAATASRWPTISASAGFGRSFGTEGYDALFEPNPLDQSFSFGLSVSVPVFTRLQASSQIAHARVAALNAGEDARATRLALEREVRSALIDLENAHRTVQLAEQKRGLASKRVDLANQQFRLGSLKFLDLQQMIQEAAQAEREALNARYDFAAARATLEETVGGSVLPLPTP